MKAIEEENKKIKQELEKEKNDKTEFQEPEADNGPDHIDDINPIPKKPVQIKKCGGSGYSGPAIMDPNSIIKQAEDENCENEIKEKKE